MDDLIATGIVCILALCAAAAVILLGIVHLLTLELHALNTGDSGFILASLAAIILLFAGYFGIGLWLRRTGRI